MRDVFREYAVHALAVVDTAVSAAKDAFESAGYSEKVASVKAKANDTKDRVKEYMQGVSEDAKLEAEKREREKKQMMTVEGIDILIGELQGEMAGYKQNMNLTTDIMKLKASDLVKASSVENYDGDYAWVDSIERILADYRAEVDHRIKEQKACVACGMRIEALIERQAMLRQNAEKCSACGCGSCGATCEEASVKNIFAEEVERLNRERARLENLRVVVTNSEDTAAVKKDKLTKINMEIQSIDDQLDLLD